MKKYIRIILPLIAIVVISYSGFRMVEIYRKKKNQNEKIAYIPPFELKSTTGEKFTKANLKKGEPVVFFYFNSECEFCQDETQDIVNNINKFKGIRLIFVSSESIPKIIMFQLNYRLNQYDNIIFLCDFKNTFSKIFGITTFPGSLVYNHNGKLVSRNNGAIKVNYLLKALNDER